MWARTMFAVISAIPRDSRVSRNFRGRSPERQSFGYAGDRDDAPALAGGYDEQVADEREIGRHR